MHLRIRIHITKHAEPIFFYYYYHFFCRCKLVLVAIVFQALTNQILSDIRSRTCVLY